jgi:hypothetical protein
MSNVQKQYADLYANTQARINTMVGESSETWALIKKSQPDWTTLMQNSRTRYIRFPVWLENVHGIKITETDSGLSTEIEIVDEKKYVLFLLKYA